MPKDKDFKRRVRARMQETGTSYTVARMTMDRPPTPERAGPASPAETTPAPPLGLRPLVIEDVGDDFVRTADGPVSRFYEFPHYEGVGVNWSSGFESAQWHFVEAGLLGGWWRAWVAERPVRPESVGLHLLEFPSADAPAAHIVSFDYYAGGDHRIQIGIPQVAAFVGSRDDGAEAWAWLAVGVFEICIATAGAEEGAVEARLCRLVRDQVRLVREVRS